MEKKTIDLIDRAALVQEVNRDIDRCYALGIGAVGPLSNFLDQIQRQPTVDAAPVVHGQWRWGMNRYKQHGAWCTNCGCGWEYKPGDFDRIQGLVIAHKYCPHCGAKMDA